MISKQYDKIKEYILPIVKLAIPITIGQVGFVLMGTIDTIMMGKVSTIDLDAVSVGSAIYFLINIIGIGIFYATGTLTSINVGAGKAEQSIPLFYSSIRVGVYLSFIFMLLSWLATYLLPFLGQSEAVTAGAIRYIEIVNIGTPFLMLFYAGKQILDGLGKTKIAMYITFVGLLSNAFFNWLLIYGNWGFAAMGLEGAAWATNLARLIMAVFMLLFVWYNPLIKVYKTMHYEKIMYDKEIFKIGLPIGFSFFFEMGAFTTGLIIAGMVSEVGQAAHQVAINLASITYMFITGVSAAGNIIVGNYYGAKNPYSVRFSGAATLFIGLVVDGFFMLLFILLADILPYLYTNDEQVVTVASDLLFLAALFQLSDGLQAVASGILRGIKDTKFTGNIAFIGYWIYMIPCAYILCFYGKMGIVGIWYAFISGLTLVAFILVRRFYYKTKENRLLL